ncbi:hypothetical protein PGTUg99_023058 [Puccinia graminis f. sp. tritici]|uniref:Uncharacterized protein n=1 Tax=Puccinia graminis f. sp. tritici TaxID=56615 RepID=A0A5B0RKX3_PUCGR|nr:hypothetical protein PGTUg99_023058 [Puccinia graminis f. sp. tritici]
MVAFHSIFLSLWLTSASPTLSAFSKVPWRPFENNPTERDQLVPLCALITAETESPAKGIGWFRAFINPLLKKDRKLKNQPISHTRFGTLDSWKKNQEQVKLLHQHSSRLLAAQEELQEQLQWLQRHRREEYPEQISEAIEILEHSKEGIAILKQWKLYLLGWFDENTLVKDSKSPQPEILEEEGKAERPFFGIPAELRPMIIPRYSELVFQELKELFTTYNILFQDQKLCEKVKPLGPFQAIGSIFSGTTPPSKRFNPETAQTYVINVLDFLVENKLINDGMVQQIFHDEKTVKQFVLHLVTCLKSRTGGISSYRNKLTETWYWPYLNPFYKILGKKEKGILNFVFLVGRFTSRKQLGLSNEPHHLHSNEMNRKNHPGHGSSIDSGGSYNEEEMESISKQLIDEGLEKSEEMEFSDHQLELFVVDAINLFSFMDKEIYPGIIKKLLKNYKFLNILHDYLGVPEDYPNPEELIDLVSSWAKLDSLLHTAHWYEKLSRTAKPGLEDVIWKKDEYDGYLDEIQRVLDHSQSIYASVLAKTDGLLMESECFIMESDLKNSFDDSKSKLNELKLKNLEESMI